MLLAHLPAELRSYVGSIELDEVVEAIQPDLRRQA
jgi:hypothetical protein